MRQAVKNILIMNEEHLKVSLTFRCSILSFHSVRYAAVLPAPSRDQKYNVGTKNPIQVGTIVGLMKGGVVPPGIEPGTHGFSVRCSTN